MITFEEFRKNAIESMASAKNPPMFKDNEDKENWILEQFKWDERNDFM